MIKTILTMTAVVSLTMTALGSDPPPAIQQIVNSNPSAHLIGLAPEDGHNWVFEVDGVYVEVVPDTTLAQFKGATKIAKYATMINVIEQRDPSKVPMRNQSDQSEPTKAQCELAVEASKHFKDYFSVEAVAVSSSFGWEFYCRSLTPAFQNVGVAIPVGCSIEQFGWPT